jgi:hypothetical protein
MVIPPGTISQVIDHMKFLDAVKGLIQTYIQAADNATPHTASSKATSTTLVDYHEPPHLETILQSPLSLPEFGGGDDALLSVVRDALFKYSINT